MISAANFDAVSFDVFGTILDWEPEIAAFLTDWASSGGLTTNQTELLAAYDRIRQPLQDERPALRYPEVLMRTLANMGDEFGIDVPADTLERFSRTAAAHKPFADSVNALEPGHRDGGRTPGGGDRLRDDRQGSRVGVAAPRAHQFTLIVSVVTKSWLPGGCVGSIGTL